MSRAAQFCLTAPAQIMSGLIDTYCSQPAPLLKHLELVAYLSVAPQHLTLRDTLFSEYAPNLHHLVLSFCNFSWSSPLFTNLRHIEILDVARGCRPTMTTWLEALGNMHHLHTIVLHEATPILPATATTIPNPKRVLTLPSLCRLDLGTMALDCANILNHLCIPSVDHLKIDCKSKDADSADVVALLPLLSGKKKGHGVQARKRLRSLTVTLTNALTFMGWEDEDADHPMTDPVQFILDLYTAPLSVSITRQATVPVMTEEAMLSKMLATLPVANVHSATFQDVYILRPSWWTANEHRLPNLRKLCVAGDTAYALLTAFHANTHGSDPDPEASISPVASELLLPQLDMLSIQNEFLQDDALVDTFCDTLMYRCEVGGPLGVLKVANCDVYCGNISQLSEIVPQVDWDGLTYGNDHSSDDDDGDDDDDDDDDLSDSEDSMENGSNSEDEDDSENNELY
ncbi:hypothetical protein EW146_g10320 [Bondarzewia mesenterica]|uniref:F-box domain-containing protein n=1 Tax=Bondarzewia mesenterica TaxID=1095465 RepID=A0A4S4L060_9AGAM|nr:hypothetical protein EW146_g10320 [Bondarzewia mesenterica]